MSTQYAVTSTTRNLVLGAAALLAVGTGVGTVAAGDDSRITGAIQSSVLTANGDLLTRAGGAPARLGVGTSGYVLTVSAGAPAWAPASTGGTYGSGTLAARPASPAAGDTYAVTSGAAVGDRYACFIAGGWTLVGSARDLAPTSGLLAHWPCDDARQGSGYTLVNAANPGTYDLTVGSAVAATAGGPGHFGRAIVQPSADASTASNDHRKGATAMEPASITVLAWVILRALPSPNDAWIALKRVDDTSWAGSNTFASVGFGVKTTGQLFTEMRTASNNTALVGTDPIQVGRPCLVAATFDGNTNTAALWLDGTAQGTLARSAALAYGNATNRSWSLAGNFLSTGATLQQRFPGSVERVRVYDRVLTAAEMIEVRLRGLGLYEGQ